jgi:chromosome segregation protein
MRPAAERAAQELGTFVSRPRPILLDVAAARVLTDLDEAREREVEARLKVETARERARAEQLRAVQPSAG